MESMVIEEITIPGCYIIKPEVHEDQRGSFVKTFHYDIFKDHGLETSFREEFYTTSHNRVLRGLHFQRPPHDHTKLVYCLSGKIFDVVVDLRSESTTYGRYYCCELSKYSANMLYVPRGLAHGFYVQSDSAIVVYNVSTIHSPDYDDGILWDSVDVPWPDENPILSDRDKSFTKLVNFITPF
jgi:dTDP-4-dehydrorhamnose 3,5-epimerase